MDDTERNEWISEELSNELAETAATLTRLGVTLANVPLAVMPREQREQIKRVTGEAFRFGALIPRTVTAMLQDTVAERRAPDREDLGSRLRREREEEEARAHRENPSTSEPEDPQAEESPMPGGAEATEEVEEDLQDAWNDPPLEPDDRPGS